MPRLVTVCRPAIFFFILFLLWASRRLFCHNNSNLYRGYTISVCSRQFQYAHGNFNFTHGNFNFTYGNFNFTYGDFNLLTAISQFYSRQLQFFHGNAHGIFRFAHHLSATAADSGLAPKVKTQNQKSIFKVDLQKEKVKIKIDLRASLN